GRLSQGGPSSVHGRLGLLLLSLAAADAPSEDHLDDTLITAGGERRAVAEVELPVGPEVEVRREKNLVLLLAQWLDALDGAGRTIVLDGQIDARRHVVPDVHVRREIERLRGVRAAQRLAKHGIERDVPGPHLLVDDRTELIRPRVGRELRARV